jgi:glycosyltransferase involved in cell wall biosynthesis
VKVLISAYSCEPGKGSEAGVGWNWVSQIARYHEVWVITRSKNRGAIEAASANESVLKVHWIYCDVPGAEFWAWSGESALYPYHIYILWQIAAYFLARKLHSQVRFDLVHHVTFVNYWLPSLMPFLSAPFVWGPVGGGESSPRTFQTSFSLWGKTYEVTRKLARIVSEANPIAQFAARRIALALATTTQTAARMQVIGCRNVKVISAVGLPEEEIHRLANVPVRQGTPLRVLSIGDLVPWKGFELGVRAFALFQTRYPESEYWLIGDGRERKRLERRVSELKLNEKVVFWGRISRQHVLQKLAECDVLLFPALHDSGGWVSVEAMAAGRPVICLDLGGPALQVTPETGIKVAAINPEQAVEALAEALAELAGDPARRIRMCVAARERIGKYFNSKRQGEQMAAFYEEAMQTAAVAAAPKVKQARPNQSDVEATGMTGVQNLEKP